ncbi:hypothetical protein IW261DRAFT_1420721 [Armillaria novae-zelandiae]|uniref:C2H2-type domain-containing protein n=1 Tax=Armillaria novae-zelandiae TaxID=153914 RepID=A0AA39P5W2_9AGAR|nr:hypothetical protein IW261DRAFT_1420721 [Armillaria novae-zelandiae]
MPKSTPDKVVYMFPQQKTTCEVCRAVVKNLKRHMDTHRPYSERRYPCPWPGCTVVAPQKSNLKVHINCAHTGAKPYVCPIPDCEFVTGDSSRLTRHRRGKHAYIPPKRENRNRRAVKVEDGCGADGSSKYIIVESAHAGPISTKKSRQRRPLGNKGQEELPISALPFSFTNATAPAPAYTPAVYDQPRVQHPMTVEYRFPASWIKAEAPLTPEALDATYHTDAPTTYTCNAMYPSSQYHQSEVPKVFAGQPYAAADQVVGGWSCPQAASYVDYGYAQTGVGVGGAAHLQSTV